MRRSRSALVGLALAVAASAATACSRSRATETRAVAPPEGTGITTIPMDGTWAIADVARSGGDPTPLPLAGSSAFLGIHQGQLVRIANGRLVDELGDPLYDPGELGPDERYVNVADGRVVLFTSQRTLDTACVPLHVSVDALLGSVDEHSMRGQVAVFHAGGCPLVGGLITPPIDGRYDVRLVRVFF